MHTRIMLTYVYHTKELLKIKFVSFYCFNLLSIRATKKNEKKVTIVIKIMLINYYHSVKNKM